ncbi:MAG: DUF72 domain-containing protein [Candidatus Eremiobacter antarcticus]|nr:MAG: DUF72 domain-containing protein [Candidatus Eremiobacter sp. RRmetagenome_bin22]
MTAQTGPFYVGTSGWSYQHWRGRFYPKKLPASQWLLFYTEHFRTVEINASFYRLPKRSVFKSWRKQVPQGFVFAVKGSRYLTHLKRLKEPAEPVERLMKSATGLGAALGPLLYQLPPKMERDDQRLEDFLRTLAPEQQHVLEFRNKSWLSSAVFDLLRRYNVALCAHDMKKSETPPEVTASFGYVRLHGSLAPFTGRYSDRMLKGWAQRLMDMRSLGARKVYVYFNNDVQAHAVKNAKKLIEILAAS